MANLVYALTSAPWWHSTLDIFNCCYVRAGEESSWWRIKLVSKRGSSRWGEMVGQMGEAAPVFAPLYLHPQPRLKRHACLKDLLPAITKADITYAHSLFVTWGNLTDPPRSLLTPAGSTLARPGELRRDAAHGSSLGSTYATARYVEWVGNAAKYRERLW